MGLDVIEIIMACEDAFGISIPDEQVQNVLTAGDLHAVVMRLLEQTEPRPEIVPSRWRRKRKPVAKDLSDVESWQMIRDILAEHLAIPAEQIHPHSRFLEDLGAS